MKKITRLTFRIFISLCLIIFVSCTHTSSLTTNGKKVLVRKSHPSDNCKMIKQINIKPTTWKSYFGFIETSKGFENRLRNEAAIQGGNYLIIDVIQTSGTTYKCP